MPSLAATLLVEAADRVAVARQRRDTTESQAAWRDAESAQRRVVSALMDVRKNMLASEELSELIRLMDEIVARQKDLNRETDRKADRVIENIFEN